MMLVMICAALCVIGAASAQPFMTEGTAWTLPADTASLDLGLGGTAPYAMGGLAGMRVGLTDHTQLGANLAHALLGVLNLHGKATLLDRERSAVSLSLGGMWLDLERATYIPLIDPDVDDTIDTLDVFVVPTSVAFSREGERLSVDVLAGWDHAWVSGRPSDTVLIFDGALGVRRAWVAAGVRLPLSDRWTLRSRSLLPLYTLGRTVAVAEYTVDEGVVVGVRSSDWFPLPMGQTLSGRLSLSLIHI